MASKKRPFSEEEDTTAAKKRALTGPNGSPLVNGAVADSQEEPTEADNLEVTHLYQTHNPLTKVKLSAVS